MVLQPDQQRVCTMLKDTITLLCKNGLSYKNKFCVEAVIGVTLDDKDMFHISMSQVVKSSRATSEDEEQNENKSSSGEELEVKPPQHKRRKQCMVKKEKKNSDASSDDDLSDHGENDTDKSMLQEENMSGGVEDLSINDRENKCEKDVHSFKDNSEDQDDIVFVKQEVEDDWSFARVDPRFSDLPDTSASQNHLQQQGFRLALDQTSFSSPACQSQSGWQAVNQSTSSSVVTSLESPQLSTKKDQSSIVFGGLCCPLCPKILVNSSGLRLHMNLHEGKYRYHCKVCQKGFMSSTTLRGHMTRHTGIKEYKCPLCGKEFGHKYSYRKHIASVHQEQVECQNTFDNKRNSTVN